ncbi:acyl dehydratase [Rhodococcus sp. 27YEA15]|uniref:MaoC family dehydratase n=1 Tax=Rhodococcus sp. 27YEA15 TaxID=3156259 RepID=UPI003C7E77B2
MNIPRPRISLTAPPEPSVFGPLSVTDFVVYQGASGDLAAIHHDPAVAGAAGYEKPFAPGMYPAGLLASWATSWLGAVNIRRYKVRFAQMVWPGDTLTCSGTITGTEVRGCDTLVDVELEARAGDTVVVKGWASFAVPDSEMI